MKDLFETLRINKANELIDLLNSDLKEKDKYQPIAFFYEKDYMIFICANKEKDIMMNVLDFEGKIPSGFSANWRTYEHIKNEL